MVYTIIPSCFLTVFESCIMTFLVADSWSNLALTVINWFNLVQRLVGNWLLHKSCSVVDIKLLSLGPLLALYCYTFEWRCMLSIFVTGCIFWELYCASLLLQNIPWNVVFRSGLEQTALCTPEEVVCRLQKKYLSVPFFFLGDISFI